MDGDHAAAPRLGRSANPPAMALHDGLGQRQPAAHAVELALAVQALEQAEQPLRARCRPGAPPRLAPCTATPQES